MWNLRALVLLLAAATSGGISLAGDGRAPLWSPTTISSSGNYVATRDFDSTDVAITINAPRVTVDLNGFTLSSTSAQAAVIALGSNAKDVTIRNGRLSGGRSCIDATSAVGVRLSADDLHCVGMAGTAVNLPSAKTFQLRRLTISGGGGSGIWVVGGRGGVIEDSTIEDINGVAVRVASSDSFTIRGNRISKIERNIGSEFTGIAVSTTAYGASIIEHNLISHTGVDDGFGIHAYDVSGLLIRNNSISEAFDGAIHLSGDASQIVGNSVKQAASANVPGVWVSGSGNRIAENVLDTQHSDGIVVSGTNTVIEWNTVNSSGCALQFSGTTGNLYRHNLLRGTDTDCGIASAIDGGGNVF